MESAVTAPVSGHVKRVAIQEGKKVVAVRYATDAHFLHRRGFYQSRRFDCRNSSLG